MAMAMAKVKAMVMERVMAIAQQQSVLGRLFLCCHGRHHHCRRHSRPPACGRRRHRWIFLA